VRDRRLTVRAIALLGAASAAVHQVRYAIGYGDAAPHALAAHGHGYLAIALPGVLTATLLALAGMLMRAAGGRRGANGAGGGTDRARRGATGAGGGPDGASEFRAWGAAWIRGSLPRIWIAATVALATIYGVQETLEGSGAFAGSGWIGLALAIPAGFLVAVALRGASAAESLRTRGAVLRPVVIHASVFTVHVPAVPRRLPDLRFGARGPPVAFVV